MSNYIYRRILKKLNLSNAELAKLKALLKPESICVGPFVKGDKICPTTAALGLKLHNVRLTNDIVRSNLNKIGVGNFQLFVFYLVFDLPSMLSSTFFRNRLKDFRNIIDELILFG